MTARKLLSSSPTPYAVWALLVAGALGASYFADPYIFAFTALILGGATSVVGLAGLLASLLSRGVPLRVRILIVVYVVLAAAAVVAALGILGTFRWA